MSSPSEARRITGILRFLAELENVAAECVATGVWDELATRRRLRADPRGLEEAATKEPQVKAL